MNKSKRVAFSWDPELKPYVDPIRSALSGFGSKDLPSSTELFLLFMTIGYEAGLRRSVNVRSSDAARFEYINGTQMSLIKSVGLAEAETAEFLLEEDDVFDVAEEYAAGGLWILAQEFDSQRHFADWLKIKLLEFSKLAPEPKVLEEA